jgi:hypothetical protein
MYANHHMGRYVYRSRPMVRVMLWLFFPLVVFLLRQSNGASAQCSELQSKISRLENELLNITEQKQKYKIFLDTCYVSSLLLLLLLLLLLCSCFVTRMQDKIMIYRFIYILLNCGKFKISGYDSNNQNYIYEENKNRLNSGSVCCHSVQSYLSKNLDQCTV